MYFYYKDALLLLSTLCVKYIAIISLRAAFFVIRDTSLCMLQGKEFRDWDHCWNIDSDYLSSFHASCIYII